MTSPTYEVEIQAAANSPCVGDCDGNGEVTADEIIIGVNIILEAATLDTCPEFDDDGNGEVAVNDLIIGVGHVLGGCRC